jgi:hypothetical protein
MKYDYNKERMEAIRAGQRARTSLENALNALDSARGWGIFDMLGGGFISTMVKHSKMDKATQYIEEAKQDLQSFSRELGDIQEYAGVDLSTGDFWGFADWFFDGLLSDWIMQDRINEARRQVQQAIRLVDKILEKLR